MKTPIRLLQSLFIGIIVAYVVTAVSATTLRMAIGKEITEFDEPISAIAVASLVVGFVGGWIAMRAK